MSEFIANEDMQINFQNTAGPPGITYLGDQGIDAVKIVPNKSTKAKANNKFICTSQIVLTFTAAMPCPHSAAGYQLSTGAGTIIAGSIKNKSENLFCLLDNDTGNCTGLWRLLPAGPPVIPCSCIVKINNAGQTKVKGE